MSKYSEREDRTFVDHFVSSSVCRGISHHDRDKVVDLATGLFRYGGVMMSDAVDIAARVIREKARPGSRRGQ